MTHQNSKSSPRPHQRQKIAQNWASGGTGMQAIFLDSGQKSCGTGVFLPQRAGTNFPPTKKPGMYKSYPKIMFGDKESLIKIKNKKLINFTNY